MRRAHGRSAAVLCPLPVLFGAYETIEALFAVMIAEPTVEPALDSEELRASIVLLLLAEREAWRGAEQLSSDMEASAREWTPQTAGEADRDETAWRDTVECFVFERSLTRARAEWHREFAALQEECARHLDHGEKERVVRALLAENGRSIRRRGWGGVTRIG